MNALPAIFDTVDDRSKAVFAAWFGLMSPGKGTLRFGMVQSRPSDEAQACLDALVTANIISREDDRGAVIYRPLVEGYPAFQWLRKREKDPALRFPLTTALPGREPTGTITLARSTRKKDPAR